MRERGESRRLKEEGKREKDFIGKEEIFLGCTCS